MTAESEKAHATAVVIDASVLTNPATASAFGANTTEAARVFTSMARQVAEAMVFYMPPSVLHELHTFVAAGDLPDDFELVVRVRGPRRHDARVSGALLHELIDDVRQRIDRGLRVAEEAVRDAANRSPDAGIRRLRDRYRTAMRTGLIDSPADVDVLLLAIELDAAVASADHGLVSWASKLGLRILHPDRLPGILTRLLGNQPAPC